MAKEQDPREISVYEIVDVIEELLQAQFEPVTDDEKELFEDRTKRAFDVIDKLTGTERESESRWSSKHIRVNEQYCARLADSLAISEEEAYDFFIGEPVKRAEKVAAWALEKVDSKILENGGVHGQRGRMVADLLSTWAEINGTGIYRRRQPEPVGTPREERA